MHPTKIAEKAYYAEKRRADALRQRGSWTLGALGLLIWGLIYLAETYKASAHDGAALYEAFFEESSWAPALFLAFVFAGVLALSAGAWFASRAFKQVETQGIGSPVYWSDLADELTREEWSARMGRAMAAEAKSQRRANGFRQVQLGRAGRLFGAAAAFLVLARLALLF